VPGATCSVPSWASTSPPGCAAVPEPWRSQR
jgi:hypothetical protein